MIFVPAWVMSADGSRVLEVNEAALDRYGWSRKEFLALDPAGLALEDHRVPSPRSSTPSCASST